MHPLVNIGIDAARQAGRIILRALDRLETVKISEKGPNDFVTEIDKAAESAIIDTIHQAYPKHGILAEESGETKGNEYTWIIDPLDGTFNFIHGYPQFCVSIAVQKEGQLAHAIIYDPLRNELFTASHGSGAYLNNRRLRVSTKATLEGGIFGTGPALNTEQLKRFIEFFKHLQPDSARTRHSGCAALDLAYVAAGRLDAYWENNLKPWDLAAGILLVQEAGGLSSDINSDKSPLETGEILASNFKLFEVLKKIITEN